MKAKLLKSLLAVLCLLCSIKIYAYDFEVDDICYNITSSTAKTVEVTYSINRYTGKVVIPKNITVNGVNYTVTSIGDNAFNGCTKLTSVTIPNSITSIDAGAFSACTGITSITIPNSVISIGDLAFYDCTNLTQITIPNSVSKLGRGAFAGCIGLTVVNFNAENCTYENEYVSGGSYNYLFEGCSNLTTLNISEGVKTIPNCAFGGCTGLKKATIPNSVISIGERAFYCCAGLTEITIPNCVNMIGNYAFAGCSGLTVVNFNAQNCTTMGYIHYPVFDYCNNITILNIGESVKTIPNYAFYDCTGLKTVTIPNCVSSIGESAFENCTGIKSLTIEDGSSLLELTGEDVFLHCPIKTLYMGRNLSYDTERDYNYSPFYSIDELESVTIGNRVNKINDWAFFGCTSLTEVTIGNSVTSICDGAFHGCSGLTEVTIPNSVTLLGAKVFEDCTGLAEVTIGNKVTSISNYTFASCTGLKDVTIGKGVTSIGDYAFYGCTSLPEITIPNSVNKIGDWAFYGCTSFTEITIPNNVNKIGDYAFTISSITDVVCYAEVPPTIYSNTFAIYAMYYGTLHVSKGCKDIYQKAQYWKDFANIVDDFGSEEFITSESVVLDSKNITAIVGETLIITATIYPENATEKAVEWSVSDTNVVSIKPIDNLSTKVSVLKEGVATITATTIDGSNLKATCKINVLSDIENVVVDKLPAEYYDLSGRRVVEPTNGIYIVKQGNTVRKVVVNE